MRWSESFTYDNGWVVGKGGKPRRIPYRAPALPPLTSYHRMYRALKTIGLTPHMLRKIAMAQYLKAGADVFDLTKIAGWSSITTAQSYVDAKDSQLEALHKVAFNEQK